MIFNMNEHAPMTKASSHVAVESTDVIGTLRGMDGGLSLEAALRLSSRHQPSLLYIPSCYTYRLFHCLLSAFLACCHLQPSNSVNKQPQCPSSATKQRRPVHANPPASSATTTIMTPPPPLKRRTIAACSATQAYPPPTTHLGASPQARKTPPQDEAA